MHTYIFNVWQVGDIEDEAVHSFMGTCTKSDKCDPKTGWFSGNLLLN
jgi:hypothetical protein